MKKLILLFSAVFMAFLTLANEVENNYIITDKACFYFKKVRKGFGNTYLVGIKANGDKQKFTRSQVLKYKTGGYIYEKAPIVYNSIKSGNFDFMKIICKRDEMTLYEYDDCKKGKKKHHKRYFVFRKSRFVVELCSHGEANLLAKFASL